jgi:hypothetical protein
MTLELDDVVALKALVRLRGLALTDAGMKEVLLRSPGRLRRCLEKSGSAALLVELAAASGRETDLLRAVGAVVRRCLEVLALPPGTYGTVDRFVDCLSAGATVEAVRAADPILRTDARVLGRHARLREAIAQAILLVGAVQAGDRAEAASRAAYSVEACCRILNDGRVASRQAADIVREVLPPEELLEDLLEAASSNEGG